MSLFQTPHVWNCLQHERLYPVAAADGIGNCMVKRVLLITRIFPNLSFGSWERSLFQRLATIPQSKMSCGLDARHLGHPLVWLWHLCERMNCASTLSQERQVRPGESAVLSLFAGVQGKAIELLALNHACLNSYTLNW